MTPAQIVEHLALGLALSARHSRRAAITRRWRGAPTPAEKIAKLHFRFAGFRRAASRRNAYARGTDRPGERRGALSGAIEGVDQWTARYCLTPRPICS